jgi:hypothetical protein
VWAGGGGVGVVGVCVCVGGVGVHMQQSAEFDKDSYCVVPEVFVCGCV